MASAIAATVWPDEHLLQITAGLLLVRGLRTMPEGQDNNGHLLLLYVANLALSGVSGSRAAVRAAPEVCPHCPRLDA